MGFTSDSNQSIGTRSSRWLFSGEVPNRFDQHIIRSVPFYREGQQLVAKVSDFFVEPESLVYDIGCATGALTEQLAARLAQRLNKQEQGAKPRIVALDLEAEMAALARQRCSRFSNVEILVADIVEHDLEPADLIVAYYTLQFVRPRFRQLVVDKVYDALNRGGAFVLFEKIRAPDARFQDLMTQLYTDFKLDQGFSEAEILAKSQSLRGILEPLSTQGNLNLMARAGFDDILTLFKYLTFEGLIAIK